MKVESTRGIIVLEDTYGFRYRISGIEYSIDESGHFEYCFTPCYSVIDLLDDSMFQGIPGLDLDLRLEKYVRSDMVPTFISERTPSENREDLWALLQSVNMEYLNRLEWLIRTDLRYHGDNLFVVRDQEEPPVDEMKKQSMSLVCKQILKRICMGYDVRTDAYEISDENRAQMYKFLYSLYTNDRKCTNRKISDSAKGKVGRKPKEIEFADLIAAKAKAAKGYSYDHIALELGISRATLFRKMKAINEKRH